MEHVPFASTTIITVAMWRHLGTKGYHPQISPPSWLSSAAASFASGPGAPSSAARRWRRPCRRQRGPRPASAPRADGSWVANKLPLFTLVSLVFLYGNHLEKICLHWTSSIHLHFRIWLLDRFGVTATPQKIEQNIPMKTVKQNTVLSFWNQQLEFKWICL